MGDPDTGPTRRRGRLQRGPTATGYRVATFGDVLKRHGLTMGLIAVLCLFLPSALPLLVTTTEPALANPAPYLATVVALLLFFALWSRRRPVAWKRQGLWLGYLFFISIVEEISFRLVLPSVLAQSVTGPVAIVLSNLVFAALHYVTLRWKARNCVVTFFGGMGLSYMLLGGDLIEVVLVHWLGTFLNTPFPPPRRAGNNS